MAGYSGTRLAKKLGIRERCEVALVGAPKGYRDALQPLPVAVKFASKPSESSDIVHVFATKRAALAQQLASYRKVLSAEAMIWVSWPKKASGVASEITEDTVRQLALPLGFVDVKVCAVDDVWSGLKLVVRKELR